MNVAAAPSDIRNASESDLQPGFWRRRLILPIRTQLTQGVSPESLSWALSAGFLTGIFPIMGTPGTLCALTGFVFRLNQPVIHSIRFLSIPLHLLLIPFFIRAGERIVGAEPIPFSIPKMLELFAESPGQFFSEFGATCIHAIVAWVVIAPVVGIIVFIAVRPILRKAAQSWAKSSPAPAE